MTMQIKAWHRGVLFSARGSAFLFGAGTPLSKSLLGTVCYIWVSASGWLFTRCRAVQPAHARYASPARPCQPGSGAAIHIATVREASETAVSW